MSRISKERWMEVYGLYDVQLVISTGVQLSDEKETKESLCFYVYIYMHAHAFLC